MLFVISAVAPPTPIPTPLPIPVPVPVPVPTSVVAPVPATVTADRALNGAFQPIMETSASSPPISRSEF